MFSILLTDREVICFGPTISTLLFSCMFCGLRTRQENTNKGAQGPVWQQAHSVCVSTRIKKKSRPEGVSAGANQLRPSAYPRISVFLLTLPSSSPGSVSNSYTATTKGTIFLFNTPYISSSFPPNKRNAPRSKMRLELLKIEACFV